MMYAKGQGVIQDYVMAHMWFNITSSNGYKDSANKRDVIARGISAEQRSEAHKLAREWVAEHQ